MKIRVTAPVWLWLEGGALFQADPGDDEGYGDGGLELVEAYKQAKMRKDGSAVVDLSDKAAEVLWELADFMAVAAGDDAAQPPPWNAPALGELNAARALMRQISRKRDG